MTPNLEDLEENKQYWLVFPWGSKEYAFSTQEWGPIIPFHQGEKKIKIYSFPFLSSSIQGVFLWNYDLVILLNLTDLLGVYEPNPIWGILLGKIQKDEIYGIPLYKAPKLMDPSNSLSPSIEILSLKDILDALF